VLSEPGDTFQESEDALDTRPDTRLAKSRQPRINIYQDLVQIPALWKILLAMAGNEPIAYQPMIVNRVNVMHDISPEGMGHVQQTGSLRASYEGRVIQITVHDHSFWRISCITFTLFTIIGW